MTTVKVDTDLRDEIAEISREDDAHLTLRQTMRQLVDEHREQRVLAQYAHLQDDPEEWADYLAEGGMWRDASQADLARRLAEDEA